MSSDKSPCAGGPGTTGMVRAWSEDPLTARARSVWTSGDFLPIARSFAAGAEELIARLAASGRVGARRRVWHRQPRHPGGAGRERASPGSTLLPTW